MFCIFILAIASVAFGKIAVSDPSDILSPLLWRADNAIIANYNVPFVSVQPEALPAAYTYEANSTSISHKTFSTSLNDTSVILGANHAELNLSFVDIHKSGYASNLLWSSFYGFNAAVNIVSTPNPRDELDSRLIQGKCVHSLSGQREHHCTQRCRKRVRLWNG